MGQALTGTEVADGQRQAVHRSSGINHRRADSPRCHSQTLIHEEIMLLVVETRRVPLHVEDQLRSGRKLIVPVSSPCPASMTPPWQLGPVLPRSRGGPAIWHRRQPRCPEALHPMTSMRRDANNRTIRCYVSRLGLQGAAQLGPLQRRAPGHWEVTYAARLVTSGYVR